MVTLFRIALLVLGVFNLSAQGWDRTYLEGNSQYFEYEVVDLPNGDFLLSAYEGSMNQFNMGNYYYMRLDPNGNVIWKKTFQEIFQIPTAKMLRRGNDLYTAVNLQNPLRLIISKVNALDLSVIWRDTIAGAYNTKPLVELIPQGLSIAYYKQNSATTLDAVLTGWDENGNTLWETAITPTLLGNNAASISLSHISTDPDGNTYLTASINDTAGSHWRLLNFDASGNLSFQTSMGDEYPFDLIALNADNIVVAEQQKFSIYSYSLNKKDSLEWRSAYVAGALGNDLIYLNNGGALINRITLQNNTVWEHQGPSANFGFYPDIRALPDGGLIAYGGTVNPWISRLDPNGQGFSSSIQGKIYVDDNDNCAYDTGTDIALGGVIVTAEKGGNKWFGVSDAAGHYRIPVDSGQYLIHFNPMMSNTWYPCTDSVTQFVPLNTSYVLDNYIRSDLNCPIPLVNIEAQFLRRCIGGVYAVQYANNGDITADSAWIRVQLDTFLSFSSATLPSIDLGNNTYDFFVGDIPATATGSFKINVDVACNAVLGQVHCSSASIRISNECPTTPMANADLQVTARCENDSIAFKIRNTGDAPMLNWGDYVVIEDLIVMRQGQFQLPAQEEVIVTCPSSGGTHRMYAGFESGGNPFLAPTAAIEGCNGAFQPGFWHIFPEFAVVGNNDTDCSANMGSFDPNDKSAIPVGYGDEHFIAANVPLQYTIRFQNTGTDTAFRVVIRDTLSQYLNPYSLRMLGSSHPFSWTLSGGGVLSVVYDPIALPDSNVNLIGSQGFIRFEIGQNPELPVGTRIENRAGIYFDFNLPVITNEVYHQIGEDFLIYVGQWEPETPPGLRLNVIPNPVQRTALLQIENFTLGSTGELTVFNAAGGLVATVQASKPGEFHINAADWPTGTYLFRVSSNGAYSGSGKLVVQR